MKTIRIKFNKELYGREAIEAAVEDYIGLACFCIDELKYEFGVNLSKIDEEIFDRIEDEFCNYVLAKTINL